MIEPDIDAYGTLARPSALADYLELLALAGKKCTRSQLQDAVRDRYWTRKRTQMIVGSDDLNEDGEFDDEDTELLNHADEAFDCLDERVDVLGDRYPFIVRQAHVALKSGIVPEEDVYVAALCLTAAHAYSIDVALSVTDLFEQVVASTLESRQLLVAPVGSLAREVAGRNFPATLAKVGEVLNIPTVLSGAPYHRAANDMGADVITHLSWHDQRSGRWTFVCQVTCGDSDSWKRKLAEAAPGLWAGWFQEYIDPICGLAVPHHVPSRVFIKLVQEQRKVLLDRLRLVLSRDTVSADEVKVILAVRAEEMDNVAAA